MTTNERMNAARYPRFHTGAANLCDAMELYPNTQEYLESFDRPTTMGVNGIFSTSGDSLLVSFISRIRKSFPFFTVTVYFSKGATKKTGVGFHEV